MDVPGASLLDLVKFLSQVNTQEALGASYLFKPKVTMEKTHVALECYLCSHWDINTTQVCIFD